VRNGNLLLATGLTGLYDEYQRFRPLTGFPLAEMFRATVREVGVVGNLWDLHLDDPSLTLPAHLWFTDIENQGATVIGHREGKVAAVRSRYGKGEAVWIPQPIALGAKLADTEAYSQLIGKLLQPMLDQVPFRFAKPNPDVILTVLQNNGVYLTTVSSGSPDPTFVRLLSPPGLRGEILWSADGAQKPGSSIRLGPRETTVIKWSPK